MNLHEGSALTLALSPGGHQIVMNFLGNLWTLPRSGGKATRITSLLQDTAYPTWSPDGKTIAFQSYRNTKYQTYHIWTMNPDGSNLRELTFGFYDDREPVFSPDGSKIAFSSDRPAAGSPAGAASGSYNIWVLTVATGQLTEVTHAAVLSNDYFPTWTPDGSHITFVDSNHAIESIDANGQGSTQTLYSDPNVTFSSPTYSPDGKNLAYTELYGGGPGLPPDRPTSSLTGGVLTQLFVNGHSVSGNEDVFAFPAPWLSNDTLLYAANGKIWQRNVTTGAVTNIPFSAQVSFNRPAYRMKAHDFQSTNKQPVTGILTPVLSPDGRHIVFVALNQLWEMTLNGANQPVGHPTPLTHDPYYKADPTWSPDGKSLAYSTDSSGSMAVYIRDMQTGQTRKLTSTFAGAQVNSAWSPDGKQIAFMTTLDAEAGAREMYVADVASGQFRKVWGTQNSTGININADFEPGRPTWGPDSNTIALAVLQQYSNRFREGVSKIQTVNATTGATNLYLADPAKPYETITNRVQDDGPVWSPDGKYMAYVMDSVLWVEPVNPATGATTGAARRLTLEPADQLSWSGDSQQILYDSAGTLRMVSIHGGAPTTIPVNLQWRPQGPPAGEKVIHAGTLWAGTSDTEQHNVDIVVNRNRIVSVGPARPRSSYGPSIRYVDASNDTVIPGLWDAHVHEGMDQPFAGGRRTRLELSLGITSEISMGDEPYRSLEQVESQESGAWPGPRYFWGAEPVDGRRIFYAWMRSDPNLFSLKTALRRIAKLNPDMLKTYVRLPNSYEKIAIQVGHEIGVPSFSHYFWPALAFGQDGTSHWATQRLGYQIAVSNDSIAYNDTIQLYARSGMSITNTPFSGATNFLPSINGQPTINDARMKALLSPWQYALAQTEFAAPPLTNAQLASQHGFANADVRILAAGGTVLAGTDNPIGYGNFGQVIAISALAQTGLGNYQALRAATVEPAQIMGVSNRLGTIQPGMIADMDVIHGNPLDNIETIANDDYVMQNGNLYTPQQLIGPYGTNGSSTSSSLRLAAMPRGTATVTSGNRGATVRFNMFGLTPSSTHAVDVQRGTCRRSAFGTPGASVGVVSADASGQLHGSVRTSRTRRRSEILTIRLGTPAQAATDSSASPNEPIACVTLPRRLRGQVTLAMRSVSQSGRPSSGSADLSYDSSAQTLTVHITAHGFVPGTSHAVHIHQGTCQQQGAVIYGLPDVVADSNGNISSTATVNNVTSPPPASGWYLNIHRGNSSNILLPSGNPALAFRPLLCGNVGPPSAAAHHPARSSRAGTSPRAGNIAAWQTPGEVRRRSSLDYIMDYMC
ncbi:MAG: amidohydrolase family protein [Solirubrobacteraceae bacterium]